MRTVIPTKEVLHEDGTLSLVPVIPFDQFPPGDFFAAPDSDGNLVLVVELSSPKDS